GWLDRMIRPAILAAVLAALASPAVPGTAGAQPARGARARPARATPARPAAARARSRQELRRDLLARRGSFVRSGTSGWVPASKMAGRIGEDGGIRMRAHGKARLITVYVPEVRGGVKGFRVVRLQGIARGALDRARAGDLIARVEAAYGTAVANMVAIHLDKPAAGELHARAVREIESSGSADDLVGTGRRGVAATLAGRDRWTRYQTPEDYERDLEGSLQPAARSVTTRRTADGLAVVRLSDFTPDVAGAIASELLARRPRGVVIDLRGNRGGLVSEARRLLELFAADRRVLLIERSRMGGKETVERWRAGRPGPLAGMPLVVLVDGNSASASEMLTAGLKDAGAARV